MGRHPRQRAAPRRHHACAHARPDGARAFRAAFAGAPQSGRSTRRTESAGGRRHVEHRAEARRRPAVVLRGRRQRAFAAGRSAPHCARTPRSDAAGRCAPRARPAAEQQAGRAGLQPFEPCTRSGSTVPPAEPGGGTGACTDARACRGTGEGGSTTATTTATTTTATTTATTTTATSSPPPPPPPPPAAPVVAAPVVAAPVVAQPVAVVDEPVAAPVAEPIAPPIAPPIEPSVASPLAPAVAAPAPTPAAAASPASSSSEALFKAFLEGAGVPELAGQQPMDIEAMQRLGRIMRAFTDGTIELLSSRAMLKREVRAEITMIVDEENNPFKILPNGRAVLMQMFGARMPGFLPPEAAVHDALGDLQSHQLGMVAGMRAALLTLLKSFDPATLSRETPHDGGLGEKLLPGGREARLWRRLQALHTETTAAVEDDFQAVFGRAFQQAYDKEMERLKEARRA
ncbi:type VI secretion system-associated FHA domain protein TagH [Variovorax paradoxus]|uniref:type VI secretion system-associated FHA domain protein TagH n=1 Tax=Variovorax paradoxus TaxID=34073 RepID=UPI0030CFD18F